MANDDLKEHVNSSHDFYDLLGITPAATEAETRRAYRLTALKYHPDKVGPNNQDALDKFHLLQIAYDVLSDAGVKELYDNARRARQERKEREAAFQGRRKAMMEELERRENGATKRKYEEIDEEERFERELRRLAEDGKRRRKEREERLRQEARQEELQAEAKQKEQLVQAQSGNVDDVDRSITFRWPKRERTAHLDRPRLLKLFSQFGRIDEVVIRDKRLKPLGGKHKVDYQTAVMIYESIVGAHAAISDFDEMRRTNEDLKFIEAISWAGGKEPESIPRSAANRPPDIEHSASSVQTASTSNNEPRKAPKFSFNAAKAGGSMPSLDETTMMRLKNAEKRRLEAKLRQEGATVDSVIQP